MKKIAVAAVVVAGLATELLLAQPPQLPSPQKEHEWLRQLVGEWESDADVLMEPGKPPVKVKGTENGWMLGGFWVIVRGKSEIMGVPLASILTIGYDAQKKKYVGTWVDSMTNHMWKYEGAVDSAGKTLTLNTEGPSPMAPEKTAKFKEVIEFKDKDHRVFTSSMLGDDGKWVTFVTMHSKRKK